MEFARTVYLVETMIRVSIHTSANVKGHGIYLSDLQRSLIRTGWARYKDTEFVSSRGQRGDPSPLPPDNWVNCDAWKKMVSTRGSIVFGIYLKTIQINVYSYNFISLKDSLEQALLQHFHAYYSLGSLWLDYVYICTHSIKLLLLLLVSRLKIPPY